MELTPLTALSPLDGRYATKVSELRFTMSELGLMRYRLLIEIRWLIALAHATEMKEVKSLDKATQQKLEALISNFSFKDAEHIKKIEQTTQHDLKAVEYFIQEKFQADASLSHFIPFIHFACTSEDINNLAYSLMLNEARQTHLLPALHQIITILTAFAHQYADTPMLAKTHGQAASPTTLGKELANFVARLQQQYTHFKSIKLMGKFNGAVGNFSAHYAAYPQVDWPTLSQQLINELGLEYNPYTTQIEPHDQLAHWLQTLVRINTILIDFNRDIWGYISLGYFTQKAVKGEVGSSTMPHKINPIDFENSEGNLGVANALANHLANKLPISRWQRDLTDSTVLRNLGSICGYSLVAYKGILSGLSKISANATAIQKDLESHWEVLAEAIQTVMRRYGVTDSYEQLKEFTRGKSIDAHAIQAFIATLSIPEAAKKQLQSLTPENYLGYAKQLAKKIGKEPWD